MTSPSLQIDYFGIASIIHTLLFGTYIKMSKTPDGLYMPEGNMKRSLKKAYTNIKKRNSTHGVFCRWWNAQVWKSFFKQFLNIESRATLPDLTETRRSFETLLFNKHKNAFNQVASSLNGHMLRKL